MLLVKMFYSVISEKYTSYFFHSMTMIFGDCEEIWARFASKILVFRSCVSALAVGITAPTKNIISVIKSTMKVLLSIVSSKSL